MDNTLWPTLHHVRDIINVMHHTSIRIYEEKKSAFMKGNLQQQFGGGKDIISILSKQLLIVTLTSLIFILVKENMHAEKQDHMSEEEVISHVSYIP